MRDRKCRKCKGGAIRVDGAPPGEVRAICDGCGYSWAICGARPKSPTSDRGPCFKPPMRGKHRCDQCGGKSPGAPIVHGRRSKYLPKWLGERFDEVPDDEHLTSLREDIRTQEAWIRSLWLEMAELTDGESPAQLWTQAAKCYAVAKDGAEDGLREAAFVRLGAILENGLGAAQRSSTIRELTEEKRRLVDTETKRMNFDSSNLSAKEAEAFVAFVVECVTRNMPDDRTIANRILQAIKAGLQG